MTATVSFSEPVAVSGGPQLPLRIGDTLRDADYFVRNRHGYAVLHLHGAG